MNQCTITWLSNAFAIRASITSDFEITRPITPWILIHSVQLLYLQVVITAKIPPCFNFAQRWPIWLWFWWMWWGVSVLWKSITGTGKVKLPIISLWSKKNDKEPNESWSWNPGCSVLKLISKSFSRVAQRQKLVSGGTLAFWSTALHKAQDFCRVLFLQLYMPSFCISCVQFLKSLMFLLLLIDL